MLQRDSDPTCRLCGLEVENPEHLLLDCQELCLLRGMLKIEGRRVIINQRNAEDFKVSANKSAVN